MGDCCVEGQGFEFLGYRFEAGRRWVRKKSLQGFKDKVREKTKRTRGDSMHSIIADLTPMIRGWFGYFQNAYKSTFQRLDGFIRRRLRSILRKQEKRPGMGCCHDDHRRWPNAFFANMGLFTCGHSPPTSEPIPMRKPLTGEPCAGGLGVLPKSHARFGGRGGRCPSLPLSKQPVTCHS